MGFELKGRENVYEQIVKEYKKYIELGIFKENEKLPSVRTLAQELGINPNTVQRAYTVLEEEGYIHTLQKKGVYVLPKINNKKQNQIDEIEKYLLSIKNDISYQELQKLINKIYGRD